MTVDNQHRLEILLRDPLRRGPALHTKQETAATDNNKKRLLNLAEKKEQWLQPSDKSPWHDNREGI